jgi:hypothetical protein
MNGPLPPAISFDKSAAGPAGRAGAVVDDVPGAGIVVVVDPDFPLLPLEQADASTASTVHTTIAADGRFLSKRCIRLVVRPAAGTNASDGNDAPDDRQTRTSAGSLVEARRRPVQCARAFAPRRNAESNGRYSRLDTAAHGWRTRPSHWRATPPRFYTARPWSRDPRNLPSGPSRAERDSTQRSRER